MEQWNRNIMLIGEVAQQRLLSARVAVFGIGGVGGYAAEALARAGIGWIDLFDGDVVALSNLNRQIVALHSSVGRNKAEVMRDRIQDIHPAAHVCAYALYYSPENADQFPLGGYDYIVDAVDRMDAKIELAVRASKENVRLISAMGCGNKLDPSRLEIADLYSTSVCPLARVMRRELRARGISNLKVVYSTEPPIKPSVSPDTDGLRRSTPGSVSFVPSVAGLLMAGEVARDLMGWTDGGGF